MTHPAKPETVRLCGKGTKNGPVAEASRYQFAPCVLEWDHSGQCNAGPLTDYPPVIGAPVRPAA